MAPSDFHKSTPTTPTTPHQFQTGYGDPASYPSAAAAAAAAAASSAPTTASKNYSHAANPASGGFTFDSGHFGGFHAFGAYGAMSYPYGMPMAHNINNSQGKQRSPTSPNPVGSSRFMFSNSPYSSMFTTQQQQQQQQPASVAHGFTPSAVPSTSAFSYAALNNGRISRSPLSMTGESDALERKLNSASPAASGGTDTSPGSSPEDVSS